jgi:alkaline phosphatase D
MLGTAQERWLHRGLATAGTDWNFLVQGTMVSAVDEQPGPSRRYSNDNWGSYRAARDRLVASLQSSRAANPVILTGDVHAFVVGQVTQQAEDPASIAVAPEFVATSVTSNSRPQRLMDQWLKDNPNLCFAAGESRGYLKCALTKDALTVDLMAIDDVKDPQSGRHRLKRCTVEAGSPAILA